MKKWKILDKKTESFAVIEGKQTLQRACQIKVSVNGRTQIQNKFFPAESKSVVKQTFDNGGGCLFFFLK